MPTDTPRSVADSSYLHEMSQIGDETTDHHTRHVSYSEKIEEDLPWLPPPIWKTILWFLFDTAMILISPFILLPFCYLMSGLDSNRFKDIGTLITGWMAVAYVLIHHYMENSRFKSALIRLRWNTPALIAVFTPVVMFMAVLGTYLEFYLIYFFTGQYKVSHGLVSWHEVAYFFTITMDGSLFSGNLFGVKTDPAHKATLRYLFSWVVWIIFATDTQGDHGLVTNKGNYYNQWGAILQAIINSFFITYTLAAPVLKRYLDPNITPGNRAGVLAPYYVFFSLFQYGVCYGIVEIILHIEGKVIAKDFDDLDGTGHMTRTHGTWMVLTYVLLAICQLWHRLLPHYNPKGSAGYVFCRFVIWGLLIFVFAIGYLAYFEFAVWWVLVIKLKFLNDASYGTHTLKPSFIFSFSALGMTLLWQAMTHYSRKSNENKVVFR